VDVNQGSYASGARSVNILSDEMSYFVEMKIVGESQKLNN
jgi:hypothetical protein